jgi:hypothetical protein
MKADKNIFSEQQLSELTKEQLVSLCRILQDKNTEYENQFAFLTEQINLLKSQRFGRSSEKTTAIEGQVSLFFNEAEAIAASNSCFCTRGTMVALMFCVGMFIPPYASVCYAGGLVTGRVALSATSSICKAAPPVMLEAPVFHAIICRCRTFCSRHPVVHPNDPAACGPI